MKKGKKFVKPVCWLKTVFHSGFIVSTVAFIALLLVSAGGLLEACWLNEEKSAVGITVSAVSLLVSFIGTVRSVILLNRRCFHRKFLDEKNYREEIIKTVGERVNEEYAQNGYKWDSFQGERFLCSDLVDHALFDRSDKLYLKVSPKMKPISNDRREALYQIVKKKVDAGKIIFNDKLVCLRTDLLLSSVLSEKNAVGETDLSDLQLVEVEKTDYFSNLTTNDQIFSRLFSCDYSSVFYGKDMTVDSFSALYNLSQSPAANIIGVNTLAITCDGYLVINIQNNHNDVNNHNFVPSGSGSSDFNDLKACLQIEKDGSEEVRKGLKSKKRYTCEFKKFITYGMLRELAEESHLCKHKDKNAFGEFIKKYLPSTYICGYIRLLNRGGKPDFFGVTFLDMDKEKVAKLFKVGREEYIDKNVADFNEVCVQKYESVKELLACENFEEIEEMLNRNLKEVMKTDEDVEIKISVQLYYMFKLLRSNKLILQKFCSDLK